MTEEPTSFTKTVKSLYFNIGDLYYMSRNQWYYSGKSISKESNINLRVPLGGRIEICNNPYESDVVTVANTVYLIAELCSTLKQFSGVLKTKTEIEEAADAVASQVIDNMIINQIGKKIENSAKDAFKETVSSGSWNIGNAKDFTESLDLNFSELEINYLNEITKKLCSWSGVAELTETAVFAMLPTKWAIDGIFAIEQAVNVTEFFDAFITGGENPKGIQIYAPTDENTYYSNGVSVTPVRGGYDGELVTHVYKLGVTTVNQYGETKVKYFKYDISMYKNNTLTQPTSPVMVSIPIPDFGDPSERTVNVYRDNGDGSYTNMNAVIEGNYVVFTTDHFSIYVVTNGTLGLTVTPGDVDNDGNVTTKDARLALRAAISLENYLPGSAEYVACDVDYDGKVSTSDARLILRAAIGLDTLALV